MFDLVSVGHLLVDMRVIVEEFPSEDRLSKVLRVTYGGGGSAGNVSFFAAMLGMKVACIGKVGFDRFGKMAIDDLIDMGVNISGVKIEPEGRTGFTIVIINPEGKIMMVGFPGVSDDIKPNEIDDRILRNARAVHVASLNPEAAIHALKIAKRSGALVTFDPGRVVSKFMDGLPEILQYVDIFFPNRKEIVAITGINDYAEAGKKLLEHGVKNVIVKLGPKGALIVNKEMVKRIPTYKVKTIDTTGAGDCFATGVIWKLLNGSDIEEAVRFANAFASVKTSKLGTRVRIKLKEVMELLEHGETLE